MHGSEKDRKTPIVSILRCLPVTQAIVHLNQSKKQLPLAQDHRNTKTVDLILVGLKIQQDVSAKPKRRKQRRQWDRRRTRWRA